MSFLAAIGVLMRLSWTRLWRQRAVWMALALMGLTVLFATLARGDDGPFAPWPMTSYFVLRLPLMLSAAILLAPTISEEVESKTYTYLWSRPVPRPALLLGKVAAVVPLLVVGFSIAITASWLILGAEDPVSLARVLAAAAAGTLGTAALALGAGAVFPKHPFIFVLGYVLLIEQLMPFVPTLKNLTVSYHLLSIAGTPPPHMTVESVPSAVTSLVLLSAAWIAVGILRIRRAEYSAGDE